MQRIINKEDLYRKVRELLKESEVIAPRELLGKGIFYQAIINPEDVYLGEGFTIEPLKKFFLEPSSCILEFSQGNKFSVETVSQPVRKRIIFAARPCEARGLTLLDKVFDPAANSEATPGAAERVDLDYKDNFYINNRQRTTIVGLACNKPDRSCFCLSMEGTPVEGVGLDALLFETNGKFIVETITDKGKNIFLSLGAELNEKQKQLCKQDKERIKGLVNRKIKVPESLDDWFESNCWESVSRSCISCGICTYLCPTCHCFDLVDEQRKRLRCYDGCSFSAFTLQTSGENSRPTKKERYRQRVFHKFDYFKRNFCENLCVGCGRCIRHCPVKIDIAEIVAKLAASEDR